MNLIPPLYLTVSKCRDRRLRRKALALLRSVTLKEALWNKDEVIAVGSRIIELEENGVADAMLPDKRDLADIDCKVLFEDVVMNSRLASDGSRLVTVTYIWRVTGLANPWQAYQETLSLAEQPQKKSRASYAWSSTAFYDIGHVVQVSTPLATTLFQGGVRQEPQLDESLATNITDESPSDLS